MRWFYAIAMTRKRLLPMTFAVLSLAIVAAPATAQQSRGEQAQARKELKAGNQRSLREIERKVVPRMKNMQYLGPEYDSAAMAYRLKFIRNGRVVFVDVDARTGRVLGQSR